MHKTTFAALALVAALATAGCGGSATGSGGQGAQLSLVAYSTPREAYEKLIPAFQQTPAGKDVGFTQSYGGSGAQARAVASGLHADVVALSLAPDVQTLVDAGVVPASWHTGSQGGIVTRSVVVFVVRKGNPKQIHDWSDLVKPGVQVITPNPFSSGGARWNIMAAYGAQLQQGKTTQQALDYLRKLLQHVPVQDKSARESLQTFDSGKGDVLLSYENEAITGEQKGAAIDYVIPDQTILIENPIAATKSAPQQAQAFVRFLRTPTAQKIFAAHGYRPILDNLRNPKRYPQPPDLFTIRSLGGWPAVGKRFFDPDTGLIAKIEREVGASTS
jgi:sulfate/thiosulfate transport system substrate-binding protein